MLACRGLVPHLRDVGGYSYSYFSLFDYEQKQGPPLARIMWRKHTPKKGLKGEWGGYEVRFVIRLGHSFVIRRAFDSDHSCFVIFSRWGNPLRLPSHHLPFIAPITIH